MIELKLQQEEFNMSSAKTEIFQVGRAIKRMLHENWYEQKANNNIKTSHANGKKILASLTHEKKIEEKHFSSQRLVTSRDVNDGEEFVGYLSNGGHRLRTQRLCFRPQSTRLRLTLFHQSKRKV